MKTSAKKSSTTTSTTVTQAANQPFFAKAGGGHFFSAAVQAKLTVGKPDDAFEKEADAVADQVVNRAEAAPVMQNKRASGEEEKDQVRLQPLAENITPFVQRQEAEPAEEVEEQEEIQTMPLQRQAEEQEPVQAKLIQKAEEEEPPVQAKTAEQTVSMLNSATATRLSETKEQGSPLSDSARDFMETGFGIDFGHVRIHTGGSAVALSKDLHAQAFTHGSDIYFNEGKYTPTTTDGQKLLAHELTHVVQQNKSKGVPPKPANRKLVGQTTPEPVESVSVSVPVPPSSQPAVAPVAPDESAAASAVPPAASPAQTTAAPPDRQETAKGSLDEREAATGMEQSAIEPAKAPTKPEEDPDFQEAKKSIRNDARKQKSHEPAAKKQAEMRAAAALKDDEQREQSGQEQQAAALEEAAKPKKRFDRVSFKDKLKAKIEKKLPKTEDAAKEFPSSGKLDEAQSEFGQTIGEEKGQVTGPLEKTATITSLPPGQVTKQETPLPAARPADRPSKIPSQLAAPKPRTDREISLQHESDNLDKRMAQENITEQQLAESEEPQFEQALQKKQDAQREIAAAPARYREQEEQVLEQAQRQADIHTGRELQRMAMVKNKSLGGVGVHGSQTKKESQTEIRQREIKNTINDIYSRTESDVNTILENLSTAVQTRFNVAAQKANTFFNTAVRSRLDDHYGWFTFDDKIAEAIGLSDGVAHIFLEEKQNFLDRMDTVLDDIATTVETELNRALDRIQQGRKELDKFKTTLSIDEQKFADDLIKEVEDKFTDLETSVEEQQEELLETLSDQYVENVNKLQEEFDKIDEELGSSWIADAINFIGDVANAIRRLGALLMSIVDRIADQVDAILAAPKKFFATLVSGINQGLDKFTSNIGTYLEQGFWKWLTGASSARNIQVPEKMDPQGMFSLALQMLGIDRLFFLERIRVKLGKGVEKLITGAQAAGEKLLEPVRILLDGGVGALWAWVKEEVSSQLQEIFTKIKEEIFEAIIKKAVLWVASLFIPGLGFIRLIQAIYKALRWLVDNISRIEDLVNSFLDSIALAVQGNVGAIVDKVIKGLTNGVVIAIDFLAKLVGLGNFADKLQRAIQSLRKPIQRVIDWLLTKARPVVRKLERAMQKVVKGVKKAGAAVLQAGVPQDPNERLRLGLNAATTAVRRLPGNRIGRALIVPLLSAVRLRYGFTSLEPEVRSGKWWIRGVINPEGSSDTGKQAQTSPPVSPIQLAGVVRRVLVQEISSNPAVRSRTQQPVGQTITVGGGPLALPAAALQSRTQLQQHRAVSGPPFVILAGDRPNIVQINIGGGTVEERRARAGPTGAPLERVMGFPGQGHYRPDVLNEITTSGISEPAFAKNVRMLVQEGRMEPGLTDDQRARVRRVTWLMFGTESARNLANIVHAPLATGMVEAEQTGYSSMLTSQTPGVSGGILPATMGQLPATARTLEGQLAQSVPGLTPREGGQGASALEVQALVDREYSFVMPYIQERAQNDKPSEAEADTAVRNYIRLYYRL